MINEFFCRDIIVEGHVTIQAAHPRVLDICEDEGERYMVSGSDEALMVELGGPLALGFDPRAVFFVGVNGGVVFLKGRIHAVKDVAVCGLLGGSGVDNAGKAVLVPVEVNVLEDIGDALTEEHAIIILGRDVDVREHSLVFIK